MPINKAGIYKIENIKNGKVYIGSTFLSFRIRWGNHRCELNNNKHCNTHLQFAYNKHGKECFVFKIIEIIDNKQKIEAREQFWIDSFNATNPQKGYNICINSKSKLGLKHSEETRKKISQSNMGKTYTPEQRKRMSDGQKNIDKYWMRGRKISDTTRRRLSESHMGLSQGEKNNKTTLTKIDVYFIYNLITNSVFTQKEIGLMFNVSRESISGIKAGRNWRWFTSTIEPK